MKKIITLAVLAAAMLVSFSSCKKEDPKKPSDDYPCFVYANDLSKAMPAVLELKLSDKSYYSRCAFVPFDGKTRLKYDGDNVNSLKITIEPKGSIYNASFEAEQFGLSGWAIGFAASKDSKVGDQATATIDYDYEGVTIHKTVTLKVVD